MKKNVSRFLALFLSLSMTVSCFTGCSFGDLKKKFGNNVDVMSETGENAVIGDDLVPLAGGEAPAEAAKDETGTGDVKTEETPAADSNEVALETNDNQQSQTQTATSRNSTRQPAGTEARVTPAPTIVLPVVSDETENESEEQAPAVTESTAASGSGSPAPATPTVKPEIIKTRDLSAYDLVWEDEFEGTSLDRNSWNVELHEKGWVNEEWQAYVDDEKNIQVSNGALHIKPVRTDNGDGTYSYTSGRVNTQNKHDFTYGYFECRAKVPEGKGYLPAFWMMPTNENLYGQWPRCGEIDIMEVMGQTTDTAHGTVHFGNPHAQRQGTKKATGQDYHDAYHTYGVDWEPGKITWYIDGEEYFTTSDWYSTTEGTGTVTYPAPFDQPFYMILNLAVGGSWVGYPDATTTYDDQEFVIDYVKAYQRKTGYSEEGVKAPEKQEVEDVSGNLVKNGDFKTNEVLDGTVNYEFMTAEGGAGKAEIVSDNKFGDEAKAVKISSTAAGTVDYSVQFVQAKLPLLQGYKYTVSFKAYADEARTMITNITAPDLNYSRYLQDTKLELTTEPQTYSYTFDMTSASDANGRIEFNLGNQGSTATVYITDISVEKGERIAIDNSKKALSNGNYIYNGAFQEGEGRMGDWEITGADNAKVSVSSITDGRRLVVDTTACGDAEVAKLVQKDIPVQPASKYVFSFDYEVFEGDASDLKVKIFGTEYPVKEKAIMSLFSLFGNGSTKETFTVKLDTAAEPKDKDIEFVFGNNLKVAIDNVWLVEDALIKNGKFDAGISGFEPYAYTTSDISYTIDSISEDNAFDITIKDTGAADWHIQLKQNNVELEKDQWYRFQFDVKSSIARKFMYAIQRDGSKHNDDWTPYIQNVIDIGTDYQHVDVNFKMAYDTDLESVLSFTMGSVEGKRITDQHRICIDNISLKKIDEPKPVIEGNILKNPLFMDGLKDWTTTIANWSSSVHADASIDPVDYGVKFSIKDDGDEAWNVQLKQTNVPLVKGGTYVMYFDATSDVDRQIQVGLQGDATRNYAAYSGIDTFTLEAGKELCIAQEFTMNGDTDPEAVFFLSLGQVNANDPSASNVVINHIGLVQTSGEGYVPPTPQGPVLPEVGVNFVKNADFSDGFNDWVKSVAGGTTATADITAVEGGVKFDIEDVGSDVWHVQVKQQHLPIEKGATYKLCFNATSTETRSFQAGVQGDAGRGYKGYSGNDTFTVNKGETLEVAQEFTMTEPDDLDAVLFFSLGMMPTGETKPSTVVISNVSLVKTANAPLQMTGINVLSNDEINAGNLIKNGNFSNGTSDWSTGINVEGLATATVENGVLTYDINSTGTAEWNIQLTQAGISLKAGETYRLSYDIISSVSRTIKSNVVRAHDGSYAWYVGGEKDLVANELTHVDFGEQTVSGANATDDTNLRFDITLGKINGQDSTPAGIIKVSNIRLVKVDKSSDSQENAPATQEMETITVLSDEAINANNLIKNGNFSAGSENWNWGIGGAAQATASVENGIVTYNITDVGSEEWHIQMTQTGIKMEKGAKYKLSFDIVSSSNREVKSNVLNVNHDYDWYVGGRQALTANTVSHVEFWNTPAYDTCDNLRFDITLGKIKDDNGSFIDTASGIIKISNIKLEMIESAPQQTAIMSVGEEETTESDKTEVIKQDALAEEDELEKTDESEEADDAEESNEDAEVIDENAEDDTEDADASAVTE